MSRTTLQSVLPLLVLLATSGCERALIKESDSPATIDSSIPTVHEYQLDNGLKLLIQENHRAPTVVAQIWYKIGSSYEHIGITGISHVLEHMMFKGTEKHPAGEFSRIIAANGGSENAFTGRDFTSYFQQLEKSRLPVALELEADRMRNLQLPAAEFAKELQVVIEERRLRTEDDPHALTHEKFMATAFQVNPYHNPVIGWMDDLENLTVDDLRLWYRTWYAPNNATLVVAGEVQPSAVLALAKKYFGPIEPSILQTQKPRREPPQRGERRITLQLSAELPYLVMGYKTPSLRTADAIWKPYALDVLVDILAGGNSSRFARDLVRDSEIAASADASYDLLARHDTLLTLAAIPTPQSSVEQLEQALRRQIERLHTELVGTAELARIKTRVTADRIYALDSTFYQAMQIGILEAVDLDWREAARYVDHIDAVTPEQVRQVAREFLQPQRLTVAILEPQSSAQERRNGVH